MEMKQKLLGEETPPAQPTHPEYFIRRYNSVVAVYNQNLTDMGPQLDTLDQSPAFERISRLMSRPFVKVALVLLLGFVPGVNLGILATLVFYYMFLLREARKHRRNLQRANNPLEGCYFLPEVCHQLGKHCTTLTISPADIEGFTFNTGLYEELKARKAGNGAITVTIYDQYFYDSFHLFKKEQYKVAAWILLATLLITADVIFYVALLDLY